MKTRSILLVPLLLTAACGREADRPVASTRPVAAACVSRPEGSRWAGEYKATAVFGDSEEEEMSGFMLAGLAVRDSLVYVMEADRAALWILRPDLSLNRRIGRDGRGPGEWRAPGPANQGGSMKWVHPSSDGFRVFEGERIQEFSKDGRFRRVLVNGTMEAGISPLQSRLAFVGDTLLYSGGGYDVLLTVLGNETLALPRQDLDGGRSLWWVRMRAGEQERTLLQLALIPVDPKWGPGPAQALPLWDSNGTCVVASDGAEPIVVYAPVGGGEQDSVGVPLPDRAARAEDYTNQMTGVLPAGTRLAEPSAPKRVRDLIIDPDGFVWLLPVQPREGIQAGVEVIRVPLGGGVAVLDTIPAFPRVFLEPGVYFAETHSADGEILVTRYDRSSETPLNNQ